MQALRSASDSTSLQAFEAAASRARQALCLAVLGSNPLTQRRRHWWPLRTYHTQSPQRPLLNVNPGIHPRNRNRRSGCRSPPARCRAPAFSFFVWPVELLLSSCYGVGPQRHTGLAALLLASKGRGRSRTDEAQTCWSPSPSDSKQDKISFPQDTTCASPCNSPESDPCGDCVTPASPRRCRLGVGWELRCCYGIATVLLPWGAFPMGAIP